MENGLDISGTVAVSKRSIEMEKKMGDRDFTTKTELSLRNIYLRMIGR